MPTIGAAVLPAAYDPLFAHCSCGAASSNLMPHNGTLNLLRRDYGAIIRMILGKLPFLSDHR
jgi:hypothetical protein